MKCFSFFIGIVFLRQTKTKTKVNTKTTVKTNTMALYHKFHGDFNPADAKDTYHGEYDDEAYGSLYIPHLEEQLASEQEVTRIFSKMNIGDVTTVTFAQRVAPATYKGKNTKKVYSAIVYLKWYEHTLANQLRQAITDGDSKNTKLKVANDQYWVIHYNTVFSDELYDERYLIADLEDTAVDTTLRVLEETAEDMAMYDLEDTAKDVTARVLEETAEDWALYDLDNTAKDVASRILKESSEELAKYLLEEDLRMWLGGF